jgi:uncharacterized secreted protein with C-terminal beta-propeller domain
MSQETVKMMLAVAMTAVLACTGTYVAVSERDAGEGHNVIGAGFPALELGAYVANDLFEPVSMVSNSELSRFASFDEFRVFCEEHSVQAYYNHNHGYYDDRVNFAAVDAAEGGAPMASGLGWGNAESDHYTGTNIQVTGVDEGDIVKNDGEHAYVISASGESVFIIRAYPPEQARVLSEVNSAGTFVDMYVDKDELIMLEQVYYFEGGFRSSSYQYSDAPMVNVKVYDMSNRSAPELSREAVLGGTYVTSRFMNEHLYAIGSLYIREWENESQVPMPIESIYHLENGEESCTMTTFMTLDLEDAEAAPSVMGIVMSSSNNIYVSEKNMYITHTKWSEQVGTFGGYYETEERTVIHRLGIQGQDLKYKARGEVPGRLLNRFSMDEFGGHFRVATTKGQMWSGDSDNMVHVLDMALEPTGSLGGIAPGEEIYSARFMGTRLYLVTFRQVDPFFAIDLHDAENPKILGELKIPGYSTYLHPYDDNHIIGLGKDGSALKLSLFNVSDVENPTELDTWTLGSGNGWSDSPALYDPHAFMFSPEKGILAIPVEGYSYNYYYGSDQCSGAYVFDISPEDGITLKGVVEHDGGQEQENEYYDYYYCGYNQVRRSFIIGDALYTVSNTEMRANSTIDLQSLASVDL